MTAEQELAARIHAAPFRIVLAVTGGGSEAVRALLCVPGASRTMLEALAPYSAASLVSFLGAAPEQFCSAQTARAMAMAAYERARRLLACERGGDSPRGAAEERVLGVACTASLASLAPKRGAHRAHVAVQSSDCTETVSLELEKGARRRVGEEQVVGRLILHRIAAACGLAEPLSLPLRIGETTDCVRTEAAPAWRDLLRGDVDKACVRGQTAAAPDGVVAGPEPAVVFPGAFNPLHDGHRAMAQAAADLLGRPVHFELAIVNVDKPPLDFTEIATRIGQFADDQSVWLTRTARFLDKARLFPGAVFVVGADTMVRVGDPQYYGGDEAARRSAIEEIREKGCRFLVFGRIDDGAFQTLSQLALPDPLRAICDEVPESRFRDDVSSTELRRQGPVRDTRSGAPQRQRGSP